eukprot:6491060-Amphidinium_carterae.2
MENGKTTATGSQCEECYNFHATVFKVTPWRDFVDEYWSNEHFQSMVQEAKKKYTEGSGNGRETVSTESTMSLEVERTYLVATERDLRRLTGLTRIPKSMTKSLPQLSLPFEKRGSDPSDGEMETHFVFADDDNAVKRARVKVTLGSTQCKAELLPTEVFRDGQASEYLQHFMQVQQQRSGLEELLQKEVSGHLALQSLSDFVGADRAECVGDIDAEPRVAVRAADGVAQSSGLVGVAAAALSSSSGTQKRTMVTPPSKQSMGSVARSNSGLGGSSSNSSHLQPPVALAEGSPGEEATPALAMSSRASEADGGYRN